MSAAATAPGQTHQQPLSDTQLREIYRAMLRIRTVDDRMMTLQRQGRIGFYGACPGQEAAVIASAYALKKSDWIFPALREGGAMLLRGYPLVPYLAQLFGNKADVLKGRQMPSHYADKSVNQVSWSSVIGTQMPHAVGAAYAARLQGKPDVMMAYMGDGATSASDFHSALTFAAVWKAPVVFFCQNNHWSISIPTHKQCAARMLADKARGYGMPGLRVDGNDAVAVYEATHAAVERARRGDGPTFIEAETYRIGAHSSSDDPTRYRDEREVELWKTRDPVDRLRALLLERGAWSETDEATTRQALLEEVNAALAQAEAQPEPETSTIFEDVYAERPWHLEEQLHEAVAAAQLAGTAMNGAFPL